ncbi:hypothetical protein LAUMK41_04355 [Mycobacterium attenuatum]|nr:hypothetical protein LAUMK41_04355 [Mycobacterium attenuatum]
MDPSHITRLDPLDESLSMSQIPHDPRHLRIPSVDKSDAEDFWGQHIGLRRRTHAASRALGALALIAGVTSVIDEVTPHGSDISAGRLTITLATCDEFKSDTCSSENSGGSTDSQDTDAVNSANIFTANSNNYENGLKNPFTYDKPPSVAVIIDSYDILDVIDFLNQQSDPIEMSNVYVRVENDDN